MPGLRQSATLSRGQALEAIEGRAAARVGATAKAREEVEAEFLTAEEEHSHAEQEEAVGQAAAT